MFGMGIWKDDNAIFFKLEHINESAGFFGKGLIGDSMYRFSFTPYWFIYKLFGNASTFPYYLFIFLLYFISTIVIFVVFSKFISKKAGIIASILFACGYVGSEGYFWLANGFVSDLAVILFSLLLFFYYKYYKKRKLFYYLLAVILFWATAYFVPIRSYYFIAPILIFEAIFFAFKKIPNTIITSIMRSIPFLLIFRHFFLVGGDSRATGIKDLIISIIRGNIYPTYGMFSSISNSVVSDNISTWLFNTFGKYAWYIAIVIGTLIFYLLVKKTKHPKVKSIIAFFLFVIWDIFSKPIFNVPVLNLSLTSFFILFLGGIILFLLSTLYFVIDRKYKKRYLFFFLSFIFAIGAYYAYNPLVSLNTTHRYLTGAFYFLIALLAICFISLGNKARIVIVAWGIINLFSSFIYQHQILISRSIPVDSFYKQLSDELPTIKKGNLLYFDLANTQAREHFTDAISTASMPDETSFAWRYKIDRYDFKISQSFDIKDVNSFDSFYYNGQTLINTTQKTKNYLIKGGVLDNISFSFNNGEIKLKNPIDIMSPVQLKINLSASPPDLSDINFPLNSDTNLSVNTIALDSSLRNEAFVYQRSITNVRKKSKVLASSSWMSDLPENIFDYNNNTNWRANRIAWNHEDTFIGLDLGKNYQISKLVWINGFGNSTPTKYSVQVSNDGVNWSTVSNIISSKRIDDKTPQVISFNPQNTRYIRMNLKETLDSDAPQISEMWPVTSDLASLDINDATAFLSNPLGYVGNKADYAATLSNLNYMGQLKMKWLDKSDLFNVLYDGKMHEYIINLPAGGYNLSNLTISQNQINGTLNIKSISVRYLKLTDINAKK